MNWVNLARTVSGSIDALIMLYALVRAFSFTGSSKYMRLALSSFATALTYNQFTLIADPVPLTARTWVSWAASLIALAMLCTAIRADTRTPQSSEEP